jgi:hypothetical protein
LFYSGSIKVTIDISDDLYCRIQARAESRRQTVEAVILCSLHDIFCENAPESLGTPGWRSVFGAARAEDVAAVQRILDKDFSQIAPESCT